MATARKSDCPVDRAIEDEVLAMVRKDQVNRGAMTWEATFHPEPAHSFGYALLSMDALDQPPSIHMDAVVHHLLIIQGRDGQWHNNLPRPPIQSSDISATALAIKALASYGFPGLQNEIQHRIERAQNWLWNEKPLNTEERAYQLLGLVWSGENKSRLEPLVAALLKEQHQDGGWAQLPHLSTDAYATGQALYALQAAALKTAAPEYQRGIAWLLQTQLDDGSWFVARRAFPFQPTMKSGFPHSRDSWISASGTSWATMAISLAIREPELHASSRN